MLDSGSPIYVYRVGHLGDSLVALPALYALKGAAGSSRLILISDRVPGEHYLLSWDVFSLTDIFSDALFYTPINRSLLRSSVELAKLVRNIHRIGKGLLFYLPRAGAPIQMIRKHVFFFQHLCSLEMFGVTEAIQCSSIQSGSKCSVPQVPEHRRLLDIVKRYIGDSAHASGPDYLPREPEVVRQVDHYWTAIPEGIPAVALGPGTKVPCNRWPIDRYGAVGKFIIRNMEAWPVVFGGTQDREVGNELLDLWNGEGLSLCGLSISEAAEALRRCSFFIGNDTGTMHLAASVGLKCLVVSSCRNPPERWYPLGEGHIILKHPVPCEGCMLTVCSKGIGQCILGVSVDQVTRAAMTMKTETLVNTLP